MSNYAIQVDDSLSKDLTQAELKVIQQVGFGLSNKEIAQKLYLSEGTVRNYVSIVLSKLELLSYATCHLGCSNRGHNARIW